MAKNKPPQTEFKPTKPRQVYDPLIGGMRPAAPRPPRTGDPAPFEPGGAGYVPSKPQTPASPPVTPENRDPGAGDGDDGWRPWASSGSQDSYAAMEAQRRRNAIEALRGVMAQMGLSSLMDKITQYVQDGYDSDAIMSLIRNTPEYDARFPGMKRLAAKGRAISEAEYIAYEKEAIGMERQYGLPAGMLNSERIANLLDKEVSSRELEERITLAAASAFQMSSEAQNAFQKYYNIGPGGLTAYFLDPEAATPLLNKQFVSAKIGGEATRQNLDVDKSLAELLQVSGVTADEAQAGFSKVSQMRGLTQGFGDVVSQRQLISSELQDDAQAKRAVERASNAKAGAFMGGGGFATTQQGTVGLQSATR